MIVRTLKDYPEYAVSKCGVVYSVRSSIRINTQQRKDGYIQVNFNIRGTSTYHLLHRLVYEAWVGIPEGLVVDHKDDDRSNCHLDNLQAITTKENNQRKFRFLPCPELVDGKGQIFQITRPIAECVKDLPFGRSSLHKLILGQVEECKGWRLLR